MARNGTYETKKIQNDQTINHEMDQKSVQELNKLKKTEPTVSQHSLDDSQIKRDRKNIQLV